MNMKRTLIVSLLCILSLIIPISAEETPTRDGYYELGVFAYEAEQYAEAEGYLLKARQRQPQDPYINHYLGRTYLQLKQSREASSYLNLAHTAQPEMPGLKHDLALLHQLQADYANALSFYKEHLEKNPGDAVAVYHAGICAFSLERFEEAVNFFQRAGAMSPSLTAPATYYSGISYYRLNRPGQAIEQFEQVRTTSDSAAMRSNAANWQALVSGEDRPEKPYWLHLRVGVQYDDNVRLSTDDLNEWLGLKKDESDFALVAYLSGRYDLLDRGAWKGGIGYNHYQTRYDRFNDYDLIGGIGDLFLEYHRFPLILGFAYQPSYYWLHTDSYLARHQFGPHITWQVNPVTFTTVMFNHKRNNYFTDTDRDGYANEMVLHIDYRFTEEKVDLRWTLRAESNHADRSYEDYRTMGTRFRLAWQLADNTRLGLNAAYEARDFDAPDPIFKFTRKDKRYSGGVSLEQTILREWLGLALEYDIIRNDANNKFYDYTRNCVTLSVIANL